DPGTQLGNVEDLGGPTPENYKADDDSAKLKEPSATLKQVRDVVTKGAKPADPMPAGMKEEAETEEEEILEDAADDEEVIEAEGEEVAGEEVAEEEEEEEEEVEEEYGIEEDVQALFSGEDLSEEFQEKARTIFETAIKSKVAEVKEQIEAQYEATLIEEIQSIKSELTERLDAYLEYVADEWIAENALAIEHGLKTEMTESFLAGMKGLFEEHYVTIPEDRYDVIESMVDKLDEMETKLNEQIQRNVALNKRLAESVTDAIFAEVAEGLALTQKEKLASLAENVEFDSESNYREKLVTLRNSYFSANAGTQRDHSENLSEGVEPNYQPVSGLMETYLQTLSRVSKK
ncbi:MAG: T4 prohead core scaffold protein, partial [Candidatus Nanopelagicaceae bacterium]